MSTIMAILKQCLPTLAFLAFATAIAGFLAWFTVTLCPPMP